MGEKKPLIIDDDDNIDYFTFNKHLEDDTERKKQTLASAFDDFGDIYLKEINKKKKNNNLKKNKLIPYILKHSDDMYSKDTLLSYSYKDVKEIYDEVKIINKSFLIKFFEFVFNIE